MKDKIGYEIRHGQDVKFIRLNEIVEVIGEVVEIFDDSVLVQDEETDTYEILPNEVEVLMNMQCNACRNDFNQADACIIMEEIGKSLIEVKCCPHCKCTDIEEKPRVKMKYGLYAIWGKTASDKFEEDDKINMNPNDGAVNYYSFDSKKERDSFLLGANEANGWDEYSFLEEENSKIIKKSLVKI